MWWLVAYDEAPRSRGFIVDYWGKYDTMALTPTERGKDEQQASPRTD